MVTEISNFAEFEAKLKQAITEIAALQTGRPDPVLSYVEKQLRDVESWTVGGRRPTPEQLRALSFGIVASREVHDRHPELAQQLYPLASFLIHWGKDGAGR